MANKKIRIRLKAYEHRALDLAASKIVESAQRTGAKTAGPLHNHSCDSQIQRLSRTIRNAYTQTFNRHLRTN